MTTPLLSIHGLRKVYGDAATAAVHDASFQVAPGEIFTLIGPSGCGKSTLLRMIAGFEVPQGGSVRLDGRDITAAPPEKRRIGIVFQDYALFPHLSARDNVAFALRGGRQDARRARAEPFLASVGLEGLGDRFPDQLSGGQQQRVALARTLAGAPRLILLDEPFSNLDASLRDATRREIREILRATGVGAIFVTHDQEEALSFADRVAVMRAGRILQVGEPEEIYARPADRFVAGFLGRTNLLPAEAGDVTATSPLGEVILAAPAHGSVLLSLRPEQLAVTADEGMTPSHGAIVSREFKGRDVTLWVQLGPHLLQVDAGARSPLRPGDQVRVTLREGTLAVALPPEA